MEITTMQMYWLVMLDKINDAVIAVLIFSIVLLFFSMNIISEVKSEKKKSSMLEVIKVLSAIAVISGLLFTFLPSTKQMAAIMIVPRLANSEKVQTIGNKVYDPAVEWMEELKPTKGSEGK
jgi:hypothetical protein